MTNTPARQGFRQKHATYATLGMASLVAAALLAGCKSNAAPVQQAPIVDGSASATDPADANMAQPLAATTAPATGGYDGATAARNGYAPAYSTAARNGYAPTTRVAGESYSAQDQNYGENYPAQTAGRVTRNEAYNYNTQAPQGYAQNYNNDGYPAPAQDNYTTANDDQLYSQLLDPDVPITQQPPPPLPQYEQPVAPGPDYLWTPGYWNYATAGYYYVPGNWVAAPFAGALWTPGWWGYTGRGYGWHHGYWGSHVGYYGGVNYGFGFIGIGYQGGYWNHDHFYYNQNCNHVEPRVVNNYVYQRNVTVVNNTYINNTRVSYAGGPGGLSRRPTPAEFVASREVHMPPMHAQVAERQAAEQNRQQFFSSNNGRPQQLFAAHPAVQQNVQVPPQLQHAAAIQAQGRGFANAQQAGFNGNNNRPGTFNNVQQPGFNNRPGAFNSAQQPAAQQLANQQRQTQEQQRFQQQQALSQQRFQQAQQQNQQREAASQQRLQQQGNLHNQQEAARTQQEQSRVNAEQQRQQFNTQQQAQRQQQEQQRLQANTQQQNQRQQQELQRNQQQQAARQQQDNARLQQQNAARQQQDAARQQQQNMRAQQDNLRQQQQEIQRQQQQAQRQQVEQQRVQQQAARPQMEQRSVQPQPQRQAAPAPRAEAPRAAAPAPHMEAPHAAPAPANHPH